MKFEIRFIDLILLMVGSFIIAMAFTQNAHTIEYSKTDINPALEESRQDMKEVMSHSRMIRKNALSPNVKMRKINSIKSETENNNKGEKQ